MHRHGSSPLCSAELTILFNLFVLTNHGLFQSALYLPAQPSAHFTKALLSGSVAMAVDRHSADPGQRTPVYLSVILGLGSGEGAGVLCMRSMLLL